MRDKMVFSAKVIKEGLYNFEHLSTPMKATVVASNISPQEGVKELMTGEDEDGRLW